MQTELSCHAVTGTDDDGLLKVETCRIKQYILSCVGFIYMIII
jgi:hypothetical protein